MRGHASIAITLDTNSHVLPTVQVRAAQAIEETVGREPTIRRELV